MRTLKIPHVYNGFILVATIWILASISLAAAAFALWIQRSVDVVGDQTEYTQHSIDMISTKSTILYLLATRPKNKAGVLTSSIEEIKRNLLITADPLAGPIVPISGDELKLDNQTYIGINNSLFSLHDEAGLIYINNPTSKALSSLILNLNYSEQEKSALIDKLNDYIDVDDLNRIQGAESYHYRKQGLPPPTNKKLTTPLELNSILGWRKLLKDNPDTIKHITTAPFSLMNINAISAELLKILTNFTSTQVNSFMNFRSNQPFKSISQVDQVVGTHLYQQDTPYTTYPSHMTRLYLWHKKSRLIEQISIELTPRSVVGKPWKISNSFALSKSQKNDKKQPVQPKAIIFNSSVPTIKN